MKFVLTLFFMSFVSSHKSYAEIEMLSLSSDRIIIIDDELRSFIANNHCYDKGTLGAKETYITFDIKRIDRSSSQQLPKHIGSLLNLQKLFFTGAGLKKIPESIGYLQELTHLDLSNNNLENLPASFIFLENLIYLNLENNKFTIFPEYLENFRNLKKLEYLNIGNDSVYLPGFNNNKIHSLPEWINKFSNLFYLNISGTNITTLPTTFSKLSNLQVLCIQGTPFEKTKTKTLNLPDQLKAATYIPEFGCLRTKKALPSL